MELKVTNRLVDGVMVIECTGRLIFGEEAALLRETVKSLLPQNKRIVVNLHNVSYIDSGGLGMLVGLYSSAHNAGGEIKLAELTTRVNQLLQVTKLLTVFDVKDTERAAIDAFGKAVSA